MGDVIRVEPTEDSYVNEWRAVRFDLGDWEAIKRLLRPGGFVVFVDLSPDHGPTLVLVRQGVTTHIEEGAWLVISPHDKVFVVPESDMWFNFINRSGVYQ